MIKVEFGGKVYAIIIKNDYSKDGIEFFTPDNYSQQLAYMRHPAGKSIDAHVHNIVKREVEYTQEVLIIRKGHLRVDFYDDTRAYLKSVLLEQGDIILLAHGAHGFKCLDDVEMIEVKQGPYLKDDDKIRFKSIADSEVRY